MRWRFPKFRLTRAGQRRAVVVAAVAAAVLLALLAARLGRKRAAEYRDADADRIRELIGRYRGDVEALASPDVEPAAVYALIWVESRGRADAYRYEPGFLDRYLRGHPDWKDNPYVNQPKRVSASYGPVQVMYPTAWEMGYRGEPEGLHGRTGLDYGIRYYRRKLELYGNPVDAAAAYNAGSVRRSGSGYANQEYVDRWRRAYGTARKVLEEEGRRRGPGASRGHHP